MKNAISIHINPLFEPFPQNTAVDTLREATQLYTNELFIPSMLDYDVHPPQQRSNQSVTNDGLTRRACPERLSGVADLIPPQQDRAVILRTNKVNPIAFVKF